MNNFCKSLKVFALLIAFFVVSCDEIPDGIVEQTNIYNKVKSVVAPSNFSYSSADSLLKTSIEFESSKCISKVWLKVISQDGTTTVNSSVEMLDNGNTQINGDQKANDNIFSAKVGISKKFSNGKYNIEYYVEDNVKKSPENVTKAAVHVFTFDNNQISLPPSISNLTIPNSVNRGESFVFTIKADDPNGLGDISQVYFKLVRPDCTTSTPAPQDNNGSGFFLMRDDGNANYGDQTAGDGIYSFKNSFGTASLTGLWKFEFQAKDKSGNLSNVIIHNMSVN